MTPMPIAEAVAILESAADRSDAGVFQVRAVAAVKARLAAGRPPRAMQRTPTRTPSEVPASWHWRGPYCSTGAVTAPVSGISSASPSVLPARPGRGGARDRSRHRNGLIEGRVSPRVEHLQTPLRIELWSVQAADLWPDGYEWRIYGHGKEELDRRPVSLVTPWVVWQRNGIDDATRDLLIRTGWTPPADG